MPKPAGLTLRAPNELTWRTLGPLLHLVVGLLYRVRVVGVEHLPATGPVLVAPNHVSYLDPVVLLVVLRRLGRRARFLAVASAFRHPLAGWALRTSGMIPVDPRRMLAALAMGREALRAGECVVAYPEGAIPAPGARRDGRGGAGVLAAYAPVVPVGQWGMQRGAHGRVRLGLRRPAAIVFGEALPPASPADGSPKALTQRILAAVDPLVAEARRRVDDDLRSASSRRPLPR